MYRRLLLASLSLLVVTAAPEPAGARRNKKRMVVVYDGFGTPAKARVWGRVLYDKGFDTPQKRERWTRRLRRSWRLLESDEIPHAKLTLVVGKTRHALTADEEGLFMLELVGLAVGPHTVGAELPGEAPYRVLSGRIMVAPKEPGVAVLSDIDDTVLQTGVKNKLKMIKKVLFSNVHQLKTYPYAAALYRALAQRGAPVVFVSGSPINLYPRLHGFFRLRGFPRAPMRLKNLGVAKGSDSLFEQKKYKLGKLREALALLPGYRFILIGDSGEKDPEIYRTLRAEAKRRIAAVLIHNVSKASAKHARYRGQHLFGDYRQAARYLAKRKLLSASDVTTVASQPALAAPDGTKP